MKSTAVVFVLTILINIGILFLGINCTTLGLISPIEVVEEWGCHDTEIRLTCGHLDSKLAILEATFTPNCTDPDCLRIDLRRLVRVFSPQKSSDPRAAEAEAGRKFLETLRKTHAEDDSADDAVDDVEVDGGDSSIDGEGGPKADRLIGEKARKASLRVSLERLIIRYLRELSPDEDFNFQVKRSFRSKREVPVANLTERIAIGERNIIINESDTSSQDRENERLQRLQKARTFCPEQRRKVSSLDRYDIERAFKNETEDEYNIRRIINRRCSGKNHCSFLFNIDHPFTQVWDSGIVRVKYLCMEDFRANHYCGEHFTIGYEVAPEIRTVEPPRGEPIAEARTQLKEPGLHSLKIIKTSDDVDEEPGLKLITSTDSRKRKIKVQQPTQEEVRKAAGVYSQDFRVLKILPSNLDDFNDIEKIGDEIYFRTNDKTLDGPESEPEPTASTQSRHTTREISTTQDIGLPSSHPTPEYVEKSWDAPVIPNEIEDDMSQPEEPKRNYTKFENITMTIREGEQYSFTYPRPREIDNLSLNTSKHLSSFPSLPPANISATEVSPSVSTSPESFLEPPLGPPENISTRLFELIEKEIEVSPTADEDLSAEGSDRDYDSVGGGNRIIEDVDSFYDDDLDNNSDEDDDDDRISYSSIQRTFYGRPLLHGFTMTPGYPKYYIGDSECKWVLNAPAGQKIRLNILDISLRYDEECRDFMEIMDLEIGRPLFNSCTEAIRPLEIISDTNKVEVIVKTTTKFAYPKRGVLIHYSALGCVNPPPPKNGRLINRTETTASFECDPSFVFPDSGVNRRQLVCTHKHSWDRILPDCVEELAVAGSGFISGLNLNSHKRPPDGTSKPAEMSDKEADLVYDIIIPLILIGGLFIINAIIFVVILRYRRRNKSLEGDNVELAEL